MSEFTIESAEGLPIRGNLDLPRDPRALVVIAHGWKGFKDWGFFPWLAEYLCRQRLAVARFNMSRSGIGENPESFDRLDLFAGDTYSAQVADLIAVTRWASARLEGVPVFLLGHSRGGGVALLAASSLDLKGIVTWSAISRADRWDEATKKTWRAAGSLDVVNQRTKQTMKMSTAILDDYEKHRHDIAGAAKSLTAPLLVIHGARDESVPADEARVIASAARDSSLMIIEGASHTLNAIHPLIHVPKQLTLAAAVSAAFMTAR